MSKDPLVYVYHPNRRLETDHFNKAAASHKGRDQHNDAVATRKRKPRKPPAPYI